MQRTVLVTGSTGFVGNAVLRSLNKRQSVRSLALMRAATVSGKSSPDGVMRVVADLQQPGSLAGICDGVEVLVHCASYVGPDPELCDRVNRAGTESLIAEAVRAGVKRIVSLSTASVYGHGPHRALPEEAVPPAPVSAASASRLAAETYVREAGGCVVRPHLVYGPGDRWVVPTLSALFQQLPGWVGGGAAVTSLIDVDALGRAVAQLAADPVSWPAGGVLHAAHPEPVAIRDIGATLAEELGIPVPGAGDAMSLDEARAHFRQIGARERYLSMLSTDHWYDASRLWAATGCTPGPAFAEGLARSVPWYRQHLPQPGR